VSWQRSWNVDLSLAFAIIGITALVLLLLGHVFGTMFRSKSPLLALDFVLLVGAGYAVAAIIRTLLAGFAADLTTRVAFTLFGAIMLILLGCGAWQLAKGRADRRQNHIELSRFVWISLAVVLTIGAAYSAWVVHISPDDLTSAEVMQPDQGSWGFLFGRANHRLDYHALFAYDLATGDSIRLNGIKSWFSSGFSRDGSRVAYLQLPDFRAGVGELYVLPLHAGATPEATRISAARSSDYVFSDDGSRLAVIEMDGIVTVYDVASKRALVSAKVPAGEHVSRRAFFVTPDVIRVYMTAPQNATMKPEEHTIDIYELDVATRALQHTGSYRAVTKILAFTVSGDGNRALVVERDDLGVSRSFVIDARSAQVVAPVPYERMLHTMLLADGSVARLSGTDANDWTLTIHALNGSEKQIPIGRIGHLYFARELKGGQVVLSSADKQSPQLFVVDYVHGTVVRRETNLRASSIGWSQWSMTDPRHAVSDPQQPVAVYDDAKNLYAWQPLTGAKKELLKF
jgi:hypothetical protein